jgi:hypothetical protein
LSVLFFEVPQNIYKLVMDYIGVRWTSLVATQALYWVIFCTIYWSLMDDSKPKAHLKKFSLEMFLLVLKWNVVNYLDKCPLKKPFNWRWVSNNFQVYIGKKILSRSTKFFFIRIYYKILSIWVGPLVHPITVVHCTVFQSMILTELKFWFYQSFDEMFSNIVVKENILLIQWSGFWAKLN